MSIQEFHKSLYNLRYLLLFFYVILLFNFFNIKLFKFGYRLFEILTMVYLKFLYQKN